ncbi:MAG: hypothetical protein KDC07_01085 [Chitinophagaceae bacterium]|nr:hypothetical protein [Chitinophagaceae bacterium]MCB9044553.1 hypothetical protein [Chitinophagales bacterium]
MFAAAHAQAQRTTEKELVYDILTYLQTGDDSAYASLFPTYKLIAEVAFAFQPKDSFQQERIYRIRNNMRHIKKFDPEMNPKIIDMMNFVRQKGADSGVHWGDILIAKFELDKQRLPYELIGFELIAPIRLQGYIFIRDMLTRKRYGIAIRDIFLINDKWYGGTILNILEASSAIEYEESLAIESKELERLMRAKELGLLDSILAARDSIRKNKLYPGGASAYDEDEEDKPQTFYKDIIERRLYTGYFDKNIPVELYMRALKGSCPETICSWEAMYKFGDLDDYIMLEVELKPDGTFVLSEEELGVMELKLQGTTFTGTWTSVRDKTEYEAYLKQKEEIKDRKLFKLDKTFEELLWK